MKERHVLSSVRYVGNVPEFCAAIGVSVKLNPAYSNRKTAYELPPGFTRVRGAVFLQITSPEFRHTMRSRILRPGDIE